MKPFATALAICAALLMSGAAYAVDYAWTGGGADTLWDTGLNWPGAGFPGAAPGADPARVIDRAEFTDGSTRPLMLFDGTCGEGNCDCRTIIEFWMKPDAKVDLTLQVTGASLYIKQFFMESTSTASANLELAAGATLSIETAYITGDATNPADIDIREHTKIPGDFTIKGDTDVYVDDGINFAMGRLLIIGVSGDTTVTKTGEGNTGVMCSS